MPELDLSPIDHVLGTLEGATTTLVTYGDYQCPFTKRAVILTSELLDELGDGVLYVFRNFPLTHLHGDALGAARAAEAAEQQGRFWDMHLQLFRHQRALDEQSLAVYASELGLDVNRFARDFLDERSLARVRRDVLSGEALGVQSTPTFFVNGRLYDGPVDGIKVFVLQLERAAAPAR